jgi:hypothetical protein
MLDSTLGARLNHLSRANVFIVILLFLQTKKITKLAEIRK